VMHAARLAAECRKRWQICGELLTFF